MQVLMELTGDEIRQELNYPLICETMEGRSWDTAQRRRLYQQRFNRSEQKKISQIKSLAHKWYLVTGVLPKVRMGYETYMLWQKLEEFCAEVLR